MSLEVPTSVSAAAKHVNAKIGDFGLSVQSTLLPLREPLETWQWLAPEVIAGSNYTEHSDVYSFGVNRLYQQGFFFFFFF
jgi:serine/threonine protein kinase